MADTVPTSSPADRAESKAFAPPRLDGPHVYLRAIAPDDYVFLQLIETASELAPRWRFRGGTPGPDEWAGATWAGVLAQFIVLAKAEDRPVGLVRVSHASFQDGHAQFAMARFDQSRRSPLLGQGVAVFLDYVFTCWDLRKLYMEVPEYNYGDLASGQGRMFELEGRLREHSFFAGRLWDHLLLAVYRDGWRRNRTAWTASDDSAPRSSGDWEEYLADFALVARLPSGDVDADARIVDDLDLGSLALGELAALLIRDHGADRLARELAEVTWEGLTVRELFDRYVAAPAD